MAQFPTYDEVSRQLRRHRASVHIPVPDVLNIPDELRLTYRGRMAPVGDRYHNERFLLQEEMGGKMLVFCADSELSIMRNSDYLVCDGTFEMAPNSAYQLYTIHGFLRGEGMPLLWAILPNKTQATYTLLFQSVRRAMEAKFGDIGNISYMLTDFEQAAINAITHVFPEITVKGCTFHFRQALYRRITLLGLQGQYNDADSDVRVWLRQLMAMTLLPEFAVPYAWNCLRQPPVVADPVLAAKLQEFAAYFEQTWMNGSFPASLWTHFDHEGPRTTNLAEGWHNAMNSDFGMPHPSMRTFLGWLQNAHYVIQCRDVQLIAGRPPKTRKTAYVNLDKRIMDAKIKLSTQMSLIFVRSPLPDIWQPLLANELNAYLQYVAYLLVGVGTDEAKL